MEKAATKEVTIDATGRALGRVASEVAVALMGKDSPSYARNQVADVKVRVENASKLHIPDRKKQSVTYTRYTGYPGGLREEKLGARIKRKGYEDVLRAAVRGMLPANKLRQHMLKNLVIIE